MEETWTVARDVIVLLGGALFLGAAAVRFRQSAVVGYLAAGTLLGPHALGWVQSEAEVELMSELGVALLLFGIGLEFSWPRLKSFGPRAVVGGVLQVAITLVVGALAAWILGVGVRQAIGIGAMVSLSSTACVLRVLVDRAELESVHGRNATGVLLLQDMAVVPLALLVGVLGGGGDAGSVVREIGTAVGAAVGLILGLYVLLNWVAVGLLSSSMLRRNRELAVLLAVCVGLGSAAAAHYAHLSPAVGAFVAGMILGGSPFADQVRADIGSLRVMLLTLFFAAAGTMADPAWILAHTYLVGGFTAAVILGKAAIVWLVMRALGHRSGHAAATGLALAQIGEFSFVLASLGRGTVIGEQTFLLIGSATIITLFLTPYLAAAAPVVGAALDRLRDAPRSSGAKSAEGEPPEIVIVGFGPAGQRVAEGVADSGARVAVVDVNPSVVERARPLGITARVGDATQTELLESMHVEEARYVLVTVPDPDAARRIIQAVRILNPQAQLLVRSRYHAFRQELELAGAQVVVDEEQEVGRRLAGSLRSRRRRAAKRAADEAA